MWKKRLSTLFLLLVLAGLLFLAFQSATDSYKLSNSILDWLGIKNVTPSDFRTYLHIPGYLIIGLTLLLFGKTHHIPLWLMLTVGLLIGISEEIIKGFVPTRDFDWKDIGMDAVGVVMAAVIMGIVIWIRRRRIVDDAK